jgi:hypothetical protein
MLQLHNNNKTVFLDRFGFALRILPSFFCLFALLDESGISMLSFGFQPLQSQFAHAVERPPAQDLTGTAKTEQHHI